MPPPPLLTPRPQTSQPCPLATMKYDFFFHDITRISANFLFSRRAATAKQPDGFQEPRRRRQQQPGFGRTGRATTEAATAKQISAEPIPARLKQTATAKATAKADSNGDGNGEAARWVPRTTATAAAAAWARKSGPGAATAKQSPAESELRTFFVE